MAEQDYKETSASARDAVKLPRGEEFEDAKRRLADKVLDCFRESQNYRSSLKVYGKSVDEWLLRLERAYHRVHEAEELAERPFMSSYFGLISRKVDMTASFLRSKYVMHGSYPFHLNATEVVELPKKTREKGLQILRSKLLQRMMMTGGMPMDALVENSLFRPEVADFLTKAAIEAKELLREEEKKLAQRAAGNMMKVIQDQLSESRFNDALSRFVGYLALYPTAYLTIEYQSVADNRWRGNKFERVNVVRPTFRAVHPKNIFPSPDCETANNGSYIIELVSRSRAQLAHLMKHDEFGYLRDEIKAALDEDLGNWLGINDFDADNVERVDVLRCQISLSGAELVELGVLPETTKDDDLYQYFNIDVELCNYRVIRLMLVQSPNNQRTYFSASYKNLDWGVWGVSPAMMIYDRQLNVNRTQYAMNLNLQFSSGSMFEVDYSKVDNPRDLTMRPWSVFAVKDGTNGGALRMHQIRSEYRGLFAQLENEIRLADDECGLPSFLNGSAGLQGAGKTLGGLAMMQDNAVLGLKDCLAVVDLNVIKPIIEFLRDENLVNSDDDSIKGDCEVKATGLLGLENELEKSRAMAGVIPQIGAFTQQGVVPKEMLQAVVRDYLQGQGFDTSKYLPDESVSGDLGNFVASDTPEMVGFLDGRSRSVM